ncbi:MAG TPA: hypothetical protein VFP40_07310 [Terriglobales bacterium]|nr:hypothetical protein [Terriglobales bacterium]
MSRALKLFWQTLREIFDEAAYERYLAREGCTSSREAFAAFSEAAKTGRERRPRCC